MKYQPYGFYPGSTLTAESLNYVEEGIETISLEKVHLPKSGLSTDYGSVGQFAVSDGKGGITWKTLIEAEAVMY